MRLDYKEFVKIFLIDNIINIVEEFCREGKDVREFWNSYVWGKDFSVKVVNGEDVSRGGYE